VEGNPSTLTLYENSWSKIRGQTELALYGMSESWLLVVLMYIGIEDPGDKQNVTVQLFVGVLLLRMR
jgi:hypothetical protein